MYEIVYPTDKVKGFSNFGMITHKQKCWIEVVDSKDNTTVHRYQEWIEIHNNEIITKPYRREYKNVGN